MEDIQPIQQAYSKLSEAASSPEKIAQELSSFQYLISSVKGGNDAVKQLCADYIPQFLHLFPSQQAASLNAQLDLCEDANVLIRTHAIRGLETICKNNVSEIGRLVEVLAQLLVSTEQLELQAVKITLDALFALDAKSAIIALINQLPTSEEENLKKEIFTCLFEHLQKASKSIFSSDEFRLVLGNAFKVLLSAPLGSLNKQQLQQAINFYIKLIGEQNVKKSEQLQQELGHILYVQANLDKFPSFDASNEAQLLHFCSLLSLLNVYVNRFAVDNSAFLAYIFNSVFPQLDSVAESFRVKFAQSLSCCVHHVAPRVAAQLYAPMIKLLNNVLIKQTLEEAKSDEAKASFDCKHNIPLLECFLGIFHSLSLLCPEQVQQHVGFVQFTGQPGDYTGLHEKREDFLQRIQYAHTSNQQYKQQIQTALTKLQSELKGSADAELKKTLQPKISSLRTALRQSASLNTLLHPFVGLHTSNKPPVFLKEFRFSFQQPVNQTSPNNNNKGGAPATGEKRKAASSGSQRPQQSGGSTKKQGQKRKSDSQGFDGQPGSAIPTGNKKRRSDGPSSRANSNKQNSARNGAQQQRRGQQQQQQGARRQRRGRGGRRN